MIISTVDSDISASRARYKSSEIVKIVSELCGKEYLLKVFEVFDLIVFSLSSPYIVEKF